MREWLENTRTDGKLYLNNKLFKNHAELEFEDNYYSNNNTEGRIKIDDLSVEFQNSFRNKKYKFEFINADNKHFFGAITGFQHTTGIYLQNYYLKFRINKFQQLVLFEKFSVKKLAIHYKIPFSYLLSRDIISSFGFDDQYIIKFRKPILEVNVENLNIKFIDNVYFPPYKKPDELFCRNLFLSIDQEFITRSKLFATLNEYEKIMDDVMLIVSFILNHKMDWYGYKADLKNNKGRLCQFVEYKDYTKNIGDDYLFEDKQGHFEKYLTNDSLSELIKMFRQKNVTEKKKIKHFIDELILIKNKNSYKSRFIESLFLIETVCKHLIEIKNIPVLSGKGYSMFQERIKAVLKYLQIPFSEIDFKYSNTLTKANKKLLIITDYRNQIAHSDINKSFSWQKSSSEYIKVMKLLRRLIFILIDPKYQNIPYTEDPF
ncbi:MAG: hypothetical protein IPG78_06845 [Ignavibacteria bacterium]|nr:hypothetical protein [Ignavibacteria bacterium]